MPREMSPTDILHAKTRELAQWLADRLERREPESTLIRDAERLVKQVRALANESVTETDAP